MLNFFQKIEILEILQYLKVITNLIKLGGKYFSRDKNSILAEIKPQILVE